jgi:galactokinase
VSTLDGDETPRDVARRFESLFAARPRLVRAPGRVNLIGEHTDYTGGFVMPVAIQLRTTVAIASGSDSTLTIHSENVGETATIDLSQSLRPSGQWSDYVSGVAAVLLQEGCNLRGAQMFLTSSVPRGAGLSSSAALEVAAGFALLREAGKPFDHLSLAKWCQRAENEFVGARCGIMDQYIACFGQRDRALLIDCRSLENRALPLPSASAIVVINTMVKHSIASGEYNARRADCEAAAAILSRHLPHVKTLRDVTPEDLERHVEHLTPVIARRARHVVSENRRVLAAADALERGDLARFGELMGESHRSLRDDYEVSCPELDLLVELAASEPGVFGTRMTGGGFGGCTVSLVNTADASRFVDSMQQRYATATGKHPDAWVCVASSGVEELGG